MYECKDKFMYVCMYMCKKECTKWSDPRAARGEEGACMITVQGVMGNMGGLIEQV